MSEAMKIGLRVLFLVAFIYALAALLGKVQGVSIRGKNFAGRIGPGSKHGQCRNGWQNRMQHMWDGTGVGKIQSVGGAAAAVGVNRVS